jgi:hypothetical protein
VLDAAEIAARFPTTWQRPYRLIIRRLVERGIGAAAHVGRSLPRQPSLIAGDAEY